MSYSSILSLIISLIVGSFAGLYSFYLFGMINYMQYYNFGYFEILEYKESFVLLNVICFWFAIIFTRKLPFIECFTAEYNCRVVNYLVSLNFLIYIYYLFSMCKVSGMFVNQVNYSVISIYHTYNMIVYFTVLQFALHLFKK